MFVKHHTDLPALAALTRALRTDAHGSVCVAVESEAAIQRPANWNRWHAEKAARLRYESTEALFASL